MKRDYDLTFCKGFAYHWKPLVLLYDQALETKKSWVDVLHCYKMGESFANLQLDKGPERSSL
jgi:hypothetical protein